MTCNSGDEKDLSNDGELSDVQSNTQHYMLYLMVITIIIAPLMIYVHSNIFYVRSSLTLVELLPLIR